jgi:3-methylcrotonyl-CoA carboxylase alpha subunit
MFTKILIANRGEIACRVMATASRLGVKTVAVYSDADATSKHVAMADEAVHIGPAPVSESYLRGDLIIAAALRCGAQAIHPGYGFLSENPDFVEAVAAAGLVFIGPPASAIRAMGLKDAAKALMIKAGVPVVPGYHGDNHDPDFLAARATAIGYPVLIKARAGGGGKGMRLVEDPAQFHSALDSAAREARTSFGDPVCLIEKYISRPRHIEIQVFGDSFGDVIHLFERDCSLQRRHQKVIEEAPAPGMPAAMRAAMGRAAVQAAKAVGYQGAGTVEFIVDGSGPLREDGFWFMEMNTRLQVEHPVSEAITGLDFVEWQLRVASGAALPLAQDDLQINGWAFEARLYAEDVPKGFLPATGTLSHLAFPAATTFSNGAVRVDSGVRAGDSITPWYDPMIAKIIVHGANRADALNLLSSTLAACQVAGSVTNLAFLTALSRHEGFAQGQVDTGLIGRDLAALTAPNPRPPHISALAALGALGLLVPNPGTDPWDRLAGWRGWSQAQDFITLAADGERLDLCLTHLGAGQFRCVQGTAECELSLTNLGGDRLRVLCQGRQFNADVVVKGSRISVFCDGIQQDFTLIDPLETRAGEQEQTDAILAPMPGLVSLVSTLEGAQVQKGQPLMVLEAMKMEHVLTAPRDGVVAEIRVVQGDQVSDGLVLLRLEAVGNG